MMPTPRLTPHARERCVEMGISTKVAKAIVRHADVRYPARPGQPGIAALSDVYPGYAVVYVERDAGEPPVVVTVLFNAQDFAARNGTTYVPAEAS